MAVKRTKKHKQQTALRREEVLSYSIDEIKAVPQGKISKKKKKIENLFNFDTSYILKDLAKTLVVTLLVVGVLIAYTIYRQ